MYNIFYYFINTCIFLWLSINNTRRAISILLGLSWNRGIGVCRSRIYFQRSPNFANGGRWCTCRGLCMWCFARRRTDDERSGGVWSVATQYGEGSQGERERECARERYVWVREKSRLVKPLSEKPAWLLGRPALRSVLYCAPSEAELFERHYISLSRSP